MVVIPAWRTDYRSWGGTLSAGHHVLRPATPGEAGRRWRRAARRRRWRSDAGRSYGDVALNPDGLLIDCRGLDRFVAFDRTSGLLECEAGVTLADILSVICQPEPGGGGWFLPVSPGTRFVTLGGAIANDVHGKNHHRFGTIGRHVAWIELARSDGRRVRCSPKSETGLFRATIGGLGLTGVILRVGLQLRHVPGTALETEDIRFGALDEFFSLSESSDPEWEYTAAWIDCLATGARLGRGIFSRARHAPGHAVRAPLTAPRFSRSRHAAGLAARQRARAGLQRALLAQARPGGRRARPAPTSRCSIPWTRSANGTGSMARAASPIPVRRAARRTRRRSIAELLGTIAASGEGSMLAVLKMFGDLPSPGCCPSRSPAPPWRSTSPTGARPPAVCWRGWSRSRLLEGDASTPPRTAR